MFPNNKISKEEMIIRANKDAICALIVRVIQANKQGNSTEQMGCCMCPNEEFVKEQTKKMCAYQSTLDPLLVLTEFEKFCHKTCYETKSITPKPNPFPTFSQMSTHPWQAPPSSIALPMPQWFWWPILLISDFFQITSQYWCVKMYRKAQIQ